MTGGDPSPLWWAGYRAGLRDVARLLAAAAHPTDLARASGAMSAILGHWTGEQARALRLARRMSVREFAARLGVTDRQVSTWEAAGRRLCPKPVNQQTLDTSLNRASPDVLARFLHPAPPHTDQPPELFLIRPACSGASHRGVH